MSWEVAHRWRRVLSGLGALAALGCGDAPESSVTFAKAKGPIGKWEFPEDAGLDVPRDAAGSDAPRGATMPRDDADAGARKPEDEDAAITSLAFQVTTQALGGKYQPKNVGAIWVADASGKLVKSLEVWASTRVRYLSEYNKVRAGMSIDAMSRATLPNHRAHQVMWNLKDRSGAAVPAGKYKLNLELTDTDSTGKTISLDFDTSGRAGTMTPQDSGCFTQMKLELR